MTEDRLVSISVYSNEIPAKFVGPIFNLLCDLGPNFTFSITEPLILDEEEDEEDIEDKDDPTVAEFHRELRKLINRFSLESQSDTPDFILAHYLLRCIENFNEAVKLRSEWSGETTIINHNAKD